MRRRGRMGDEAFCIAEIICNCDQGKMIADGIGSLLAAKDLKSNEGATARHLPLDDLGLGMIRPAGIANLDNVTMAAQEVRDPPSALLLLANAQGKGFKRFQENPGIERRWAGTCLLIKRMNLVFDDFAAAENDAPETSAVPVDMFCRRINDAIGAKLERLLQNGRGKDVVDDKTRAIFMRYARYCSNIIYFQTWIGGRFEKQELCLGRIAARHWPRSLPSTRVEATPKRGSKSSTT